MPEPTALFTALSFLNATKQPPSLLYLLMTLGPALLALWAVDARTPRLLRSALTFGRVPLFYYLTHFALLHVLAVVVCYLRYGTAHWMFESPDLPHYPFSPPPGWGFTLPVVYLWWTSVVLAMYPLCVWFGRLKQRRTTRRSATSKPFQRQQLWTTRQRCGKERASEPLGVGYSEAPVNAVASMSTVRFVRTSTGCS